MDHISDEDGAFASAEHVMGNVLVVVVVERRGEALVTKSSSAAKAMDHIGDVGPRTVTPVAMSIEHLLVQSTRFHI